MRKEWDERLSVMAGKVAHAARKDAKRKAQLGKTALTWWTSEAPCAVAE